MGVRRGVLVVFLEERIKKAFLFSAGTPQQADIFDVSTASSADLAEQYAMEDVEIAYSDEDYTLLATQKVGFYVYLTLLVVILLF